MAECFWPGVTMQNVAAAGDRLSQAPRAASRDDASARYLGSILVPTDEIALLLLEAASLAAATELAQRAAIPFERILEVHTTRSRSAGEMPSSPNPPTKGTRR